MAEASQHEQAETVARSITNPNEQARALIAVAGALAEAGRHEHAAAMAAQAGTVAHSITNPDEQAEVAKALMARGETRQARRAASAACAVGR
jgi:hypothetical protein